MWYPTFRIDEHSTETIIVADHVEARNNDKAAKPYFLRLLSKVYGMVPYHHG